MDILIILGGSGGVIGLIAAVVVVGRGIFKQVNATEENTAATKELSQKMDKLGGKVDSHEVRIAVLEDRAHRESRP